MLAIARGLMAAPRLLLLDEPSLGLAPSTAQMLFEIIVEVRRRGITICLVEQDVHSTLEIADYAYVLEDGAIVAEGLASEMPGSAQVRESYLGLSTGIERSLKDEAITRQRRRHSNAR
jgi:branched-chain amino acid transport system ATP-binding protein